MQENTAVTSRLALSSDIRRDLPLDVHLEIVEFLFGLDITLLLVYGKYAIMYIPFGRTAFYALPSGKILAVKQNDSVGRSRETSTF